MGFLDRFRGKDPEPPQREIDNTALTASERSHLIWTLAGRGGDDCTVCGQPIRAGAEARASITAPAGDGERGVAHADCFLTRYGEEAIGNDDYWRMYDGRDL